MKLVMPHRSQKLSDARHPQAFEQRKHNAREGGALEMEMLELNNQPAQDL